MAGAAQARPKLLFLAREEVLIEPLTIVFSKLFRRKAWRKTTPGRHPAARYAVGTIRQGPGAAIKAL
jgi:hypothetical protein